MEGETTKKGMPLETTQVPTQCVDVESQRGGDYAKGKRKTSTVTGMFNVQSREVVDSSIAKFFFANAIPFHVSRSPFFKQMFKDVIAAGSSYVPPGEHKLRTNLLDKEYSKVSVVMEEMRQTWIRVGCSIIMDGWTDIKHQPLINIIVTCPAGPYFLRAIDCTGKRKDATFQFQILKDAIEEIGPSNVVQVVTDSARVCKLAGMMVEGAYKHIFWTPCCVHALNNALKDIGKIDWVKVVVAEARHIQMFICNHHTSLALFRSFSRKEFLKPVDTRYANYFILLERMLEVQEALQLMMVNQEWGRWLETNTSEGKGVKQKILDDDWWTTVRYVCSFISLVVGVIRYVDTDSPSLGEIYETFDNMLGQMKQAIHSRDPTLGFYEEHIRPIVTRRVPPSDDEEVKEGLMKAFRKMYTDEESTLLWTQWLSFVNLHGPTFSKPEARTNRATLAQTPATRWDVDPEDVSQIDEEEAQVGLVGVPLDEAAPHSSSDSESNFDATLAEHFVALGHFITNSSPLSFRAAANNLEKIIIPSEHVDQARHQNKRKFGKNKNKVNSIGNIDRFVINTCRRLKEPKTYLVWEAIRKLGVYAVQDFVEEVFRIECHGGQMTDDSKRRRTPGGILWNILKLQEPEAYKEIMLKGKDFEKELRKENNKRYGLELGFQSNSKRHRMGSGDLGRNGRDQIPESTRRNSSEPCKEKQPESSLHENSLQDPLVKAWVDGIRTSNTARGNSCRVDNVQQSRLSEKVKLPVKHRIRVPV
ncbi:hypothetical protein KI387_033426, partial [Taxus chinensis]